MASVLCLHFYGNENNGIPPELSKMKFEPSSTQTLQTFTALLAGNFLTQEEKQLKIILLLSDFKHST
jgi:hypothetical protein